MTEVIVKCQAKDCVDGFWKGKPKYRCFACSGTGETNLTEKCPAIAEDVKTLCDNMEKLSDRDKSFAQSLVGQAIRKGSLSPRQLPYFADLVKKSATAVAKPTYTPKPKPAPLPKQEDSGWEAVNELFEAAHDNGLKIARIRVPTTKGYIQFSSKAKQSYDRATSKFITVGRDGPIFMKELHAKNIGHIKRDTSMAIFNGNVPITTITELQDFKNDPMGTLAGDGKKTGNCCFCGRDLTDHRSTAHGYGPICAKRYKLAWNTESATKIEENISERVQEVLIEMNDEGEWIVKDIETGTVMATFTSRADAQAFADEFSIVEASE